MSYGKNRVFIVDPGPSKEQTDSLMGFAFCML